MQYVFMKVLSLVLILFQSGLLSADVKMPSADEVASIFKRHYGQRLLFFKPMELPIEIERTHTPLVRELEQWVALNLVTQEKTRFLAEKMMYGSLREISVGGYKYSLNRSNQWVSEQGFYYGRPAIKEVLETAEPSHLNAHYYSEVHFSWYVSEQPKWLSLARTDGRRERLLRRAKESYERPFEKRMYLIYKEGKWDLWLEKGDQPLF